MTFLEPSLTDYVCALQHFLDGKVIDVKRAVPRSESYSDVVNYDESFITNKIFIGGLPVPLDERELNRVFSDYGEITDLVIIQDKCTKLSRGFGFVEFVVFERLIKDHEAVDRVMKNYFNINVQGKWVECKKALPKASYPESMTKLMKGAKLLRFDEDKEPQENRVKNEPVDVPEQTEQGEEEYMGQFRKPMLNSMQRNILGDSTNSYRGRQEIDFEAKDFVTIQEDKENDRPMLSARLKPSDPRKGKLLQLNKARIDLGAGRENRAFTLS